MTARARRWMAAACLACLPAASWAANVEMPAIFGDGMVLQAGIETPVWGRADPGEGVAVRVAGQEALATAQADGTWRAHLLELPPGGPHRMVVEGENTLVFEDVLVGEVWLGAGQSNMRMVLASCDGLDDALAGADLPHVRVFREQSWAARTPQWRGVGDWSVCSPETAAGYSGTLFFFAAALHRALGVPVGVIDASIGGTKIESWISPAAQYGSPDLAGHASAVDAAYWRFDVDGYLREFELRREAWSEAVERARARGDEPPPRPCNEAEIHLRVGSIGHLFNGKIAPLIPYGLRGVIWYQGEENVRQADSYGAELRTLVRDWRERWKRTDLPFVWVQLPNFSEGRPTANWPSIRESMRRALCMPATGMVVTIDVGAPRDIHPPNKRDVGERVAGWALGSLYGRDVLPSGPLLIECERRGRELVAHFAHVGEGLATRGPALEGFELAGPERVWHAATARIEGASVILASAAVEHPCYARYAWANDPSSTLYNSAGLPASPFTTAEPLDAAPTDRK